MLKSLNQMKKYSSPTLEIKKTGKIYEYDTTKLQASVIPAVPVVLALVARAGIQAAIKKMGKNCFKTSF